MSCEPQPLAAPPGAWPVQVRPVHAGDRARVAEFVRSLSPASRQQRFHGGLRELPPGLAERFVHYDGESELVLVATVCAGGREVAVAEARHAALDEDATTHEFALVVHDAYRRAGLGTRLLARLVRHARGLGLRRLVGDVQDGNAAMLALAARLGFRRRRHPEDARLHRVELVLADAAAEGAAR